MKKFLILIILLLIPITVSASNKTYQLDQIQANQILDLNANIDLYLLLTNITTIQEQLYDITNNYIKDNELKNKLEIAKDKYSFEDLNEFYDYFKTSTDKYACEYEKQFIELPLPANDLFNIINKTTNNFNFTKDYINNTKFNTVKSKMQKELINIKNNMSNTNNKKDIILLNIKTYKENLKKKVSN